MRFDHEKFALEAKSGGKNTLLYDDKGMPSVMVRIPKFRLCDVLDTTDTSPHPAFIVNGKEVDCFYFSKYLNVVREDRAYSIGGVDPSSYVLRDRAKEYCEAKGNGWHLASNAEYAAISLWCKKNGFMPHGNNYCGCDVNHKWEKGVKSPNYQWNNSTNWNSMAFKQNDDGTYAHIGRTLTGSGPATWAHDGTPDGIYDLNGLQWEVMSGLRMLNGELQVIPDNNSAMGLDESRESTLWRAILKDGTYATPGIANTLKYNSINAGNTQTVSNRVGAMTMDVVRDKPAYTGGDVDDYYGYLDNTFESLTAASGLTPPLLAKAMGFFPADTSGYEGDYIYARNYGERLPLRGGHWYHAAAAGVFALHFPDARSWSAAHGGFRSAFVPL